MRVCVIGAGSIGRRHTTNLLDLGCKVFAADLSQGALELCDPRAIKFWLGPASGFVPNDFDALVIATPAESHLSWVEAAIECGVPYLVEKPLGTVDQLPRWRELARTHGETGLVGYNWRFNAGLREWMQSLDQDSPREIWFNCFTKMDAWPGGAKHGDPLAECSHEIDIAIRSFPDARLRTYSYSPNAGATLIFDHGPTVVLVWTAHESWRLFLSVDRASGQSRVFLPTSESIDESYRREAERFIEHVKSGKTTIAPLRHGVDVLELVAQVEQMAVSA